MKFRFRPAYLLIAACLLTGGWGWHFGQKAKLLPNSPANATTSSASPMADEPSLPATSVIKSVPGDFEQLSAEFLAYAKGLPREDPKLTGMALALFRLKPTETLDLILRRCSGLQRRNLLWTLLEQWSEIDHLAAWRWITETPMDETLCSELVNPMTTIASVYAKVDGSGALQAWLQLPSDRPFPDYASHVLCLHAVTKENRRQVLADVLAQPNSSRRDKGLAGILIMFTQNEGLPAAGQWLESQTDLDPETRRHMSRVIAQAAAANDPQVALDWLLPRTTEESMGEDLKGLIGEWAILQPQPCLEWVQKLPPGLQRDYCLDELVPTLAGKMPQLALPAAQLFANERRRQNESVDAWRTWLRSHPQAAVAAWPNLSHEQQQWLKLPSEH